MQEQNPRPQESTSPAEWDTDHAGLTDRLWAEQHRPGEAPDSERQREAKDPVDQPAPSSNGTVTDTVVADWDAVRDMFETAGENPVISERFGACKVVTVLRARSMPDDPLVIDGRGRLDLDSASESEATVEVELDDFDVGLLSQGKIRLAMSIAMGRASYRGPVREFLRVLPTVQAINCPPPEVGQAHDDE